SRARLRSACEALARLHLAWQPERPELGVFPAVRRRIGAAQNWCALLDSGWRPDFRGQPDDLLHWSQRAWRAIEGRIAPIPKQIDFLAHTVETQPCLCDIWHDHVLFSDETVTGVIDFGGVKLDHVTVDLARLLGSLIGDDRTAQGEG